MDSVVAQSFKNELPTIITKTLLSTTAKAAAAYGINKSTSDQNALAGLFAKIATGIYQAAVNIADTRTWTTLPKEFQFCRIPTPADRKVELSGPGGQPKAEVTIEDGTVNIIYVKSLNAAGPLLVSQIKLKPGSAVAMNSQTATAATVTETAKAPAAEKSAAPSSPVANTQP